ncbi:MAG TPA: hypothetical protein VG841_14860 [Caulobacterales bacterium]|nr:hypothetical protein [Caulobacterales bacterium]
MRALLNMLLPVLAILTSAAPAFARPALGNPFASAQAILAERGDAAHATFRATYDLTLTGGDPSNVTLIIDAAPEWALVRRGDDALLYDFELGQTFDLHEQNFVSQNMLAPVLFRVMERQNRALLQRITDGAGGSAELPDACDADIELGVVVPGLPSARITLSETRGTVRARCGRREVGVFEPSAGAAPPAAFWPTLRSLVYAHPALFARARQSGHAPQSIQASFRGVPAGSMRLRLTATETIDEAYPLPAAVANTTAQSLEQALGPGFAQIATDAVAGRAPNGPTLEAWSDYVRQTGPRDGDAAAVALMNVTFNMFPALQPDCANPNVGACEPIRNIRSIMTRDPAVRGFFDMVLTEQQHDFPSGVTARASLKGTRIEHHPVVDAAFALILTEGGEPIVAQARAAGLPTDIDALQLNAIRAYPYNPAYWTDFADRLASGYEYDKVLLLYEIAYSLPVPGAHAGAPAGREQGLERVRHDFPDYFLPQ